MSKKKKTIFSVMTGAALLFLIVLITINSCGGRVEAAEPEKTEQAAQEALPVVTETVSRSTFTEYGDYFGEIRGIREATLLAVQGGRVEELTAEEGDTVAVGDSLGKIEAERVQLMYETAVLNERIARESYEREQRFLNQGNSFQDRVDQMHLAWLQARNSLQDAQKAYDGALCLSPIEGTVVARYVETYQELSPGSPTFSVADLSRMKVTVGVPEADIAGVRQLKSARIRVASFPGESWEGTPVSFARKREARSLNYQVAIELDNPQEQLLSGQTAQVRLALREWEQAVVIPSRAIMTRNGESIVMVVLADKAREVRITPGPSNDTHTVVRNGLTGGELLITEGMNRLSDGTPVKPAE